MEGIYSFYRLPFPLLSRVLKANGTEPQIKTTSKCVPQRERKKILEFGLTSQASVFLDYAIEHLNKEFEFMIGQFSSWFFPFS